MSKENSLLPLGLKNKCGRTLAALVWILPALAPAQPTAPLNDTGQLQCVDASNQWAVCNAANTGNAAIYPGQDGRYGRDRAPLAKIGGGVEGFDFTRMCWNGQTEGGAQCVGTLVANGTATAAGSNTDWACTRDNVTGLVWSLQTQSATWNVAAAVGYSDAGHNSAARCGYATGWRLPTRRELFSLMHYGAASPPLIEQTYFPGTQSFYWTSDVYAPDASLAWRVYFNDGYIGPVLKTTSGPVRLVRSGQ